MPAGAPGSNCYLMFQPVRLLEKCLGLSQITQEKYVGTKCLHKTVFYTTALVITSIYIFIGYPFLTSSRDLLYWYLAACDVYTDVVLIWSIVISLSFHKSSIRRMWKIALDTEDEFRCVNLFFSSNFHVYSWVWLVLNAIQVFCLEVAEDISTGPNKLGYRFSNTFFIITGLFRDFVFITFTTWLFYIIKCLELLNLYLRREWGGGLNVGRVYGRISEVARSVGSIYGAPVLIALCMDFFLVLFKVHDLMKCGKDEPYCFVTSVAWVSYGLLGILPLLVVAAMVTKQVDGNKSQLFRLMTRPTGHLLKKEITGISMQLLHDDVKITACGVLIIDLGLLFEMVGAAATYLFILVQSDMMSLAT